MANGRTFQRVCVALAFGMAASVASQALAASTAAPIVVGLNADLSASTRQAGESFRRGVVLAMAEINRAGGVLGRPLQLLIRDHRSNPARGVDFLEEFAQTEGVVAVIGGAHTPTAIAQLDAVHRHGIPYLIPWAAGTKLVKNGHSPNFVFRISAPDYMVGPFLIRTAIDRGFKRPGLLLWNTSWGRSNEKAMTGALKDLGMKPAGVEWFNTSEADMSAQIDRLVEKGADVVMLVANPRDGAVAVRSMARQNPAERTPIISHWGISLGEFYDMTADVLPAVDLSFLQTFSFLRPPIAKRADQLFEAYCAKFEDCGTRESVPVPGAVAHAYDLVHLLAMAIEKAGSTDRNRVRDAMESLKTYDGVMRRYRPPFTNERHDALDASLFILCRFGPNGAILPMTPADG